MGNCKEENNSKRHNASYDKHMFLSLKKKNKNNKTKKKTQNQNQPTTTDNS